MTGVLIETDLVYYIQNRTKWRWPNHWSEWSCCSPHYTTLGEARQHFAGYRIETMWPEEIRLVRARFVMERLPTKTTLYANRGAKRRILARRGEQVSATQGE